MPRKLNPNITPEQRAKKTEAKRRWREENPEKVVAARERNAGPQRERWNNRTEEERDAKRSQQREAMRAQRRAAGVPERGKKPTPEERKEYMRRWQEAHRESQDSESYRAYRREITKAYRERHPDRNKESDRLQKIKWHDKICEYARRKGKERWATMSEEEKKQWNAYNRNRYAKDLEASREYTKLRSHRRRALEAGAPGKFTAAQIDEMLGKQKKKCATCKSKISKSGKSKYHIDHVQPLARGGSNDISNIQLLCPHCNLSKGDRDPDEWAQQNGKLFC